MCVGDPCTVYNIQNLTSYLYKTCGSSKISGAKALRTLRTRNFREKIWLLGGRLERNYADKDQNQFVVLDNHDQKE